MRNANSVKPNGRQVVMNRKDSANLHRRGGIEVMLKTWKLSSIPLMMALAYAAAHAQTQSTLVSGQYERELVVRPTKSIPAGNGLRSASIGGTLANAGSTAITGQIVAAPPPSNASWPQWGHDP